MFSMTDFKKTSDKDLVAKIVDFTSSLDAAQRELLCSLVMGRDDLLDMEEPVAVSDAEIDALLRGR